ncbi:hypothetical protein IAR50_004352 [Cryptococcus sp. DSM 104548]
MISVSPSPLKALLYGLLLATLVLQCAAYTPAVAINDTSGLNFTDSSTIDIAWTDPAGVYSGGVSFQLQADVLTGGTTSGALVHFAESTMGDNTSTTTPWIAFISCDQNETIASEEWDIFTLARDRGAKSALLYTTMSTSCLLNSEYINDFEKPLDVFATRTVQVARVIDNQFVHTNDSFQDFNSTLLNESATDVNSSLAGDAPSTKTYLIGTLTARNSTGQATSTSIPNATTSASSNGGRTKTSPGMIVLYAITGVVASMFLLMLIMGARRAMMNPGRYGRREGDEEGGGQSAAGGLAQAMLDTFPVIQFHRGARGEGESPKKAEDEESVAMGQLERDRESKTGLVAHQYRPAVSKADNDTSFHNADSFLGELPINAPPSTTGHQTPQDTPGSVGDGGTDEEQQCPICLVEFEDGDDLRVLPCERTHMYHRACIDPWLLRVSGSCPLCRKDFKNPQPPSSPLTATATVTFPNLDPNEPPTQHGFARYLAFMRRSRRRQDSSISHDPSGAGGGGMASPSTRHQRRERARDRTDSGLTFESGSGVGAGRRREADQNGPGGY